MTELRVTQRGDAVRFTVRVQPRSSRSSIDGVHGEAIKLRVQSPPVEGAANEEVIALLATALGVPKGAVSIVSGETARMKVVEVIGVRVAEVLALIASE